MLYETKVVEQRELTAAIFADWLKSLTRSTASVGEGRR